MSSLGAPDKNPASYADSARSCLFSPSLRYHWVSHGKRPISINLNSYLAARLGGIKQKKLSWGSAMNNTFLLFYSLKPGGQVWAILHTMMVLFQILLKYSYLVTTVVITINCQCCVVKIETNDFITWTVLSQFTTGRRRYPFVITVGKSIRGTNEEIVRKVQPLNSKDKIKFSWF